MDHSYAVPREFGSSDTVIAVLGLEGPVSQELIGLADYRLGKGENID